MTLASIGGDRMGELSMFGAQGGSLRDIAVMFAELGRQLSSAGSATAYDAVTQVAIRRVAGASAASITTLRNGTFTTVSATNERARQADAVQYELGSGPCVDAVLEETRYQPKDLRHDHRWPEFGRRVHKEVGWTSMLSFRLFSELAVVEVLAGLNLYAEQADAFGPEAVQVGLLLATHGAVAVAAQVNRDKSENLQRALQTNRDIGVAVGVLMTRHLLTQDQAFDLLRVASQNLNRKLLDVAVEVGDTGALPWTTR
jgi:hypothetical protein